MVNGTESYLIIFDYICIDDDEMFFDKTDSFAETIENFNEKMNENVNETISFDCFLLVMMKFFLVI